MNEKIFEDIICKYPELIENNLTFKERQVMVKGKRADVLLEDRHGQKLILELKKGVIRREHIAQLFDYEGEFITPDDPNVRVMLVGNRVPENLRRSLDHHGFEWKEISIRSLINFFREKGDDGLLKNITPEDYIIPDSTKTGTLQESNLTVKTRSLKERKSGLEITNGLTHKEIQTYKFFQQLLEHCGNKTNLFKNVSPNSYQNWIATGAGKVGLVWQFTVMEKFARTEFWLCTKSANINQKRYDFIIKHKEDIDKIFGDPLMWDFKEGRINQCIRYFCRIGGLEDESKWKAIQNDLIDHLIKMELSLKNIINQLESIV